MRNTLLKKFIIGYILIGILSFFCVAIISYRIDYTSMLKQTSVQMYKEAVDIAKDYANKYYAGQTGITSLNYQLKVVANYSNTRIMFVNSMREIILDTNGIVDTVNPVILEDFDPISHESSYYRTGYFYNTLSEKSLTVLAPITYNYNTCGYVVIHKSLDTITDSINSIFNTNYFSFLVCYILCGSLLVFYYLRVHRPLTAITAASANFADGKGEIKVSHIADDEIGRLISGLNMISNELNENDEYQKKFIANVSHDFRSPLTSIKGYLEAILDGTIPHEMQDKYLNIVLFETERLTKLTSNLLALNDMDSKKVRLNIDDFDINNVIRHTVETFEGSCKEKGIRFDITFCQKSLSVLADVDKIQQVLYNLIDNAIKFSHHNSVIYIKVSEKGDKAFISVKDTGIGIPKDSLPKIWDRFYKTDLSRGKDKKGTGLGLSIVKEIIATHNENIDVISTEGIGTEFIFSLPKTPDRQ